MKARDWFVLVVFCMLCVLISFSVLYITFWLFLGKPVFISKILFLSLPVSAIGPIAFCVICKINQTQTEQQNAKTNTTL